MPSDRGGMDEDMSLFKCSGCGCVENTALGAYWQRPHSALCSECATGKWHGQFAEEDARGPKWKRGSDGFLYQDGGWTPTNIKIIGDA